MRISQRKPQLLGEISPDKKLAIEAGAGDDFLQGADGHHTCCQDLIQDTSGLDTLVLARASFPRMCKLQHVAGRDLVLSLLQDGQPSGDHLTLSDWASDPAARVEYIQCQ